MQVRCPHCQTRLDVDDESTLRDVVCSSCDSCFSLLPSNDDTLTFGSRAASTIGQFELHEQLGVGAFGTVWRARDTQLDRSVAIKIPRRGDLSPQEADLFLREARAAAQLQHPNIVAIHEIGRDNDTIYIVNDFVDGLTLSDWLTGASVTPREAARILHKVADALEHAHQHGVVHRDLKPSNILLDSDNEPFVMDFGLAKRERGEVTMTADGKVLGTPAYMSPEQARGEGHTADGRTDIYSAGVVLFEALTGEKPFRGNVRMLLHQVLNEEAPSPRSLNNRIPRDLETICLKCLQKDPARRYPSAAELRDELARFLNNDPIQARPISNLEKAWRWCGKNKLVALLSLSLAVALLAGLAGVTHQWLAARANFELANRNERLARESAKQAGAQASRAQEQAERAEGAAARELRQRQAADEAARQAAAAASQAEASERAALAARKQAEEASEQTRKYLYVAHLNMVQQAWERGDIDRMIDLLNRHRPLPGEVDLRCLAWRYWWGKCHEMEHQIDHGAAIRDCGLSSDGRLLAVADKDRRCVIYDTESGERVGETAMHDKAPKAALFAPQGGYLATLDAAGALQLWRTEDFSLARKLDGLFRACAFSRDGSLLCGATKDALHFWEMKTARRRSVDFDGAAVSALEFLDDGQTIVVGNNTRTAGPLSLVDVATGEVTQQLQGQGSGVLDLAVSDDRVFATTMSGYLFAWSLNGELQFSRSAHSGPANRVLWSPRAGLLTAGIDRAIRRWNPERGTLSHEFKGHTGNIWGLCLSPEAEVIYTGAEDGSLLVWRTSGGGRVTSLQHRGGRVSDVAITAAGDRAASVEARHGVLLWSPQSRGAVAPLKHASAVHCLAFLPAGGLVTGDAKGEVRLWDSATGESLQTIGELDKPVLAVAASTDGQWLAAAAGSSVHVWRVPGFAQFGEIKAADVATIQALAFAPDAQTLAFADSRGVIAHCDIAQRRVAAQTLAHGGKSIRTLAFAADGRLASGGSDGAIVVWETAPLRPVIELNSGVSFVDSLAFASDGRTLISCGDTEQIALWDIETSELKTFLSRPSGPYNHSLASSADGATLLVGNFASSVNVFHFDLEEEGDTFSATRLRQAIATARKGDDRRALQTLDSLLRNPSPLRRESVLRQALQILSLSTQAVDRAAHLTDEQKVIRLVDCQKMTDDLLEAVKRLNVSHHPDSLAALASHPDIAPLLQAPSARRYFEELRQSNITQERLASLLVTARAKEKAYDWRGAIADLTERIDNVGPERVAASTWKLRGDLYARLGQWDLAIADLERAVDASRDSPLNYWCYFYLACARLEAGDVEGYEATCREMHATHGDTTEGLVAARVLYSMVFYPKLLIPEEEFLRLAHLTVNNSFSGNERLVGVAHFRGGRFAEALKWFQAADDDPKFSPSGLDYLYQAMAHHRLGNTEQADQFVDLADAWSKRAFGITMFSWCLEVKWLIRELESLDPRFEGRLVAPSTFAYGEYKVGYAHYLAKEWAAAQEALERSAELFPNSFLCQRYLGRVRFENGDLDGALEALNRAVELYPSSYSNWAFRGTLHVTQERWDEAIADYEAANEISEQLKELATLHAIRGDRAAFEAACQKLLDQVGVSLTEAEATDLSRACLLAPLPDPLGRAVLERLERFQPPSGMSGSTQALIRGKAAYRGGRFQDAIDALAALFEKPASRDNPFQVEAAFLLAMAHQKLDRPEPARQWLARATASAQQERAAWDAWNWLHLVRARVLEREAADLIGRAEPQP